MIAVIRAASPADAHAIARVHVASLRASSLDADTGEQRWIYDPRVYEDAPRGASPAGFHHRGLAFRRDGDALTLFLNSRTRLYAIEASTGHLIESFGEQGSVLLTEGHGRDVPPETYDQTSPPVVYDESNDAFGADTWENQSWRITGHANVWGLMSLDEERGLLYVPTSTPSSDYWGGRRPGANLFAESILCLDARTGERQWHFQAVHHGLWDYDFTAAPNLVTITVDGRTIDAVAEVSKQGFTYVFDRVTGEPVWPIEERQVDTTTDVPGEVPYPTQPFPTRPPPFAGQRVSVDDANDLTPEIHAMAVEEMQQFRLGPLFTPPSLRGTLQRPNVAGGANWRGAGEEVWRGATPFRPGGNPMTYRTTSGRQFVVVPTGAGPDAALVAFASSN